MNETPVVPQECLPPGTVREGITHGYSGYTHGCRGSVCRRAKAEYMAARRAEAVARAEAEPTRVVHTRSHGTRYAYEELGCRCFPCISAEILGRRLRNWSDAA